MSFHELGLAPELLRAIDATGYTHPTAVQLEAIPHVLAGRDVLACAQTGTGKTAAFALPLLHRLLVQRTAAPRGGPRIQVLVLSPTRELAIQIDDSFRKYGRGSGAKHAVVYGGVDQRRQVSSLRQGIDILIATPGRLVDLMNQGFVDLQHVKTFVLDEADRMLDMGFLPDLRRVIKQLPVKRQTIFLSATIPDSILSLAHSILRDPVGIDVTPEQPTTELVQQVVYLVQRQDKPKALAKLLLTKEVTRAIVFTRTKHGADRVVRQLNQSGIRAAAIHGNKSQSARQRTLSNFRSNQVPVLVATDVAARGIDILDVSHVLNYDMPDQPETYVHRIGRTARAGATGTAISFCDLDERQSLRAIERLIRKKLTIGHNPELPIEEQGPAPFNPAPRTPRMHQARARKYSARL